MCPIISGVFGYVLIKNHLKPTHTITNVEIRRLSFLPFKLLFYSCYWQGHPTPYSKKIIKHHWLLFDALFKRNHPLPVRLGTWAPSWIVRICGTVCTLQWKWLYSKPYFISSLENRPSHFPGNHRLSLLPLKSHSFKNMSKQLLDFLN